MKLEGPQLLGEKVGVEVDHGRVDDGQVVDVGAEGRLDVLALSPLKASNLEDDEIRWPAEGKRIWFDFQSLNTVEYHRQAPAGSRDIPGSRDFFKIPIPGFSKI